MSVRLDALEELAKRCLGTPAPTATQAHELAAEVLSVLGEIRALAAGGHPYRVESSSGVVVNRGQISDTHALVSLERALEESEARLRAALAELARLRGS